MLSPAYEPGSGNSVNEFRAAIAAAGIVPPEVIVADGRMHRFATNGKASDDAGYYVLHTDGIPAGAFGDWRSGVSETWRADIGRKLSPAEQAAHRKRMNAIRREREADEAKRRAEARERAAAIWRAASPAPADHLYLRAKGVKAHGLRVHDGALVIPMRDGAELHSIQFIAADGSKRFLTGGRVRGLYHAIGNPDSVLCVAEGYATGASVHEATGYAVAVAFSAGSLLPAAKALRAKMPDARIIIAGDNDASGVGQAKAREAAQVVGGFVAVPAERGDWNDVYRTHGADAVRAGIEAAHGDARARVHRGGHAAVSTDPAPIPDAVLHDPVIRERIETEARQCARESESAPAAIVKRAIDCAEIGDPGAPFTANVLAAWRKLRKSDLAEFQRLRAAAKTAGVPLGELDRALRANGEGDSVAGSACDLPDVEPWTHPVDGAELLDRIAAETRRYLVLPFGAAEAVALWVIHAHAHNSAAVSPILAATSPTPECGKTTLLTLLGMLVPRPLSAANITAAAVFRAVEKWRPTLLVDEADTFLRDSDELRGVLNSGHARGSAWVIRTVGEDFEPRRFATWAPKAVAMIGRLPPTLDSRAIHIELRRMTPADRVETLRVERAGHLPELARKAARFTADHARQLRDADPDLPAMLRGRPADNWRPLIAIADVAGGDWPTRARKTAETFSAGRSEQTAGIMLLEDVRQIIGERDRLTSADLAEALGQLEERPWPEWGRTGRPITPRQIARLLEPFGLRPAQAKVGGRNLRAYVRSDFADAWSRYLPLPDPLSPSATPLPANTGAGFSQFASATSAEVVADRKSPKRSAGTGCSGVADRDPHEGKRDTERPPAWMPV